MKRSFVLVLILGVFVVACSRQQTPQPAAAPAATPAAAPAAAAPVTPAAAPATPAAAESVTDFPDYPGATRVTVSQRPENERGFTRKSEASWTSTDTFQNVVAFYQKAMADRAWTVTATESKPGETEWSVTKGTSAAKVEVKQAGPQVTIKIERSDR